MSWTKSMLLELGCKSLTKYGQFVGFTKFENITILGYESEIGCLA